MSGTGSGNQNDRGRLRPEPSGGEDDPTVVAAFALALKAHEWRAAVEMLEEAPGLAVETDQSGCPMIVHAVRLGNPELVRRLCERGAKLSDLAAHGDALLERGRLLYAAALFRHGQRRGHKRRSARSE